MQIMGPINSVVPIGRVAHGTFWNNNEHKHPLAINLLRILEASLLPVNFDVIFNDIEKITYFRSDPKMSTSSLKSFVLTCANRTNCTISVSSSSNCHQYSGSADATMGQRE